MGDYGLSVIDSVDLQSVESTMAKIGKFQAVVQKTLKEGHDYGKIPGTDKPTLLKPGAEKIFMLMGLTSHYEVTEKVEDYENGFFAYTVRCSLDRSGLPITQGLGHANTKEARYARRWLTEKRLPEGVDKGNLQKREKTGQYGKYTEYLVENDDPFTLVNTVLKMAKKRAQVDAALTVGSLSELFTQDLDDMDIDTPAPKGPQKPAAAQPKKETGDIITDKQKARMFAIAGKGNEEYVRRVLEEYNYTSSGEVKKDEYEAVCDRIEELTKEAPEGQQDLTDTPAQD